MSPSAATYSTASRPAATHPAAAAAASPPAAAFTSADFAENFTHPLPISSLGENNRADIGTSLLITTLELADHDAC